MKKYIVKLNKPYDNEVENKITDMGFEVTYHDDMINILFVRGNGLKQYLESSPFIEKVNESRTGELSY